METAKRTELYQNHAKAGAKFVDFGGWEMPVAYGSIVQEHLAVRGAAGLFDVCHMGQIFVEGPNALVFLQKVCTNDIARCAADQAMYSHICDEKGGVIDDIFVYCLIPKTHYLVIVNASTIEKDMKWMLSHRIDGAEIQDRSEELAMIALQGPKAAPIAGKLFPQLPERHRILETLFEGHKIYVCRTGYTGEDGFEIVAPKNAIGNLWEKLFSLGKDAGIVFAGLGARDTLRLEVGYPLYGQELDEDHSPLEAGLSWVVKFNKPDFIGKAALEKQKNEGVKNKLIALKLTERGIPRHGSKILCDGKEAGVVTSGTFSPSLQTGIALGYVPASISGIFSIDCHGKSVPASVVQLPFYKK